VLGMIKTAKRTDADKNDILFIIDLLNGFITVRLS
jgi:hypothetical protein